MTVVEFSVIKEPWNKYKLEDGTIVSVKSVLNNVKRTINKKGQRYQADVSSHVNVKAQPTLMGRPNTKALSQTDIDSNIEMDDMEFESVALEFSKYKLEDGAKINIQAILVSVSRSSLKNGDGDPIYSLQTAPHFWVRPPQQT